MKVLLAVVALLAVSVSAVPTKLSYQVGQEFEYNLKAHVNARGNFAQSGENTTQGALSTLQGVMLAKCTQASSSSYMFVMNLFNVFVNVGQGASQEITTDLQPLGYDMYYEQFVNGTIPEIWYNSGDSEYVVDVKISAVIAFQTHVLGVGQKKKVLVKEPVGQHFTNVAGASGSVGSGSLGISKSFDGGDFTLFADSQLSPKNLVLGASANTQVHSDGYVVNTARAEQVVFVNMDHEPTQRASLQKKVLENTRVAASQGLTGLDINLQGAGAVGLTLAGMNAQPSARLSNLQKADLLSQVKDGKTVATGALAYGIKRAVAVAKEAALADDSTLSADLDTVASEESIAPQKVVAAMRRVAKALRGKTHSDRVEAALSGKHSVRAFDRLFSVLTSTATPYAETLLVKYGIQHADDLVRLQAVFAANDWQNPSMTLIEALLAVVKDSSLEGKDVSVASALALVKVTHSLPRESQEAIQKALDAVRAVEGVSNFPFNKSITKSYTVGGKKIHANFYGELFAGTNFDCKQPYFNYEALAEAYGHTIILGKQLPIFDLKGIYGKANGQVVGNELFASLFGHTYLQRTLPVLDCSLHSYNLYHTSPSWSVSYTLWISIVPVTFSAGASIVADVTWGWEVCDSTLSAMIEISPGATLVVSGEAYVNLLIIGAGLEIDASLNAVLEPQGYIHGSECTVGFDLQLKTVPMSADFATFYKKKKCKFLFFDCHWEPQDTHQWWKWSLPAQSTTLFNADYQIKKL